MPDHKHPILIAAVFAVALHAGAASADTLTPSQQAFREIYRQLIEIDTSNSNGDTAVAAEAMAARLKAGSLPADDIALISTNPRKGNVIARLRGTGKARPVLLLAHLDVIDARREDWETDPFKLTEANGEFRGRGVIDDKAMAAIFVANLIEYVKQGFKPERDIILALTADEELSDSPDNGIHWLLTNKRELIDAEFALNEGGGGALRGGRPFRIGLQLAEKVYQTFVLEATDPGGHSASPRKDNPIYRIADALRRLADYDFPPRLNPLTRGYFERLSASEPPDVTAAIKALLAGSIDARTLAPLTARPDYNAQMRTTCVATLLSAGHAENTLPQSARATVNCRILPGEKIEDVERTLAGVIGDEKVKLARKGFAVTNSPSSVSPEVMQTVARLTEEMWPGVPLNTTMSAGYTDNRWLRNAGIPAYGVSGLFSDSGNNGVHGRNERVGIAEVYKSKDFLYRLVKELAAPGQFGQQ